VELRHGPRPIVLGAIEILKINHRDLHLT
jgi:hypothetical protein